MKQKSKVIHEKYEFRNIRQDEIEQAAEIESICFPPNEACTYEHMESRIKKASDLFLVVVDRETGIMLLGLDVLPEHQHQGLARELMEQYKERECAKGRKKLILTCLPDKVEMYEKFGFEDHGIGDSVWGGEAWHEMDIVLDCNCILG